MEKIIEAAIKHNDMIYTGKCHADIIYMLIVSEMLVDEILPEEQGFITDIGRFVSRVEAAEIAFNAGQLKEKVSSLQSYQISILMERA